MKILEQRSLWHVVLFTSSLALGLAACGGLDPRKVTRGAEDAVGGEAAGGQGGIGKGGSTTNGGEPAIEPHPEGGDTSGGGAPGADLGPEVVSVTPADEADDAEPDGDVSLDFSEELDEATVTSDSVQVLDQGEAVEGELSYSGITSKFTPAQRLSLLASYDVSVSDGVTDAAGNPLRAPFSSKFTVRDGVWSSQRSVFSDVDVYSGGYDVAADAQGNLLFVYTINDQSTSYRQVFARWYQIASGWKPEVKLEITPAVIAQYPRVAVSPEGDAVVAWTMNDSSYSQYTVRARRYVSGAWSAEPESLAITGDWQPQVAVAIGGGQVAAAWYRGTQYPGYYYYSLELSAAAIDEPWPETPASNFGVVYQPPNNEYLSNPALAIDKRGLALAVFGYFSNDTANNQGVYYTRKPASGDWQYPVKIPSSSSFNDSVAIASDGEGAMAIWKALSGSSSYSLVASRYTKTKQFVAPTPISDPDLTGYVGLVDDRALVANSQGYFASFTQSVGSSSNAYATHFDVAAGKWDALPVLVSDGDANAQTSSIGVDAHGNSLLTFDQDTADGSVLMVARLTASSGTWSAAEPLTQAADYYGYPRLAVAGNGVAGVVFGPANRQGIAADARRGQYRLFR